MTLFDQLQAQNQKTQTIRPYTPLQVINYFLRYLSNLSSQDYDNYYHVRLILHYPFKQLTDLLSFDGSNYRSYTDAFQAYRQLYTYLDDFYTDLEADGQDIDSKDSDSVYNNSDNEPLADFEAFACRQPSNNDLTCSFTDDLGNYELDRTYDQTLHVSRNIITPKA